MYDQVYETIGKCKNSELISVDKCTAPQGPSVAATSYFSHIYLNKPCFNSSLAASNPWVLLAVAPILTLIRYATASTFNSGIYPRLIIQLQYFATKKL